MKNVCEEELLDHIKDIDILIANLKGSISAEGYFLITKHNMDAVCEALEEYRDIVAKRITDVRRERYGR